MHAQPRPPCLARRPAARNAAGRLLATPPHAAAAPPLPPPAAHARQARAALLERLALTPERGIFGLPEAQRAEIDALVCALERQTTLQAPTEQLASLAGDWRLLYTTLSIRGGTRTKLGLRGALTLGELTQRIVCDADSPSTGRATNCVQFSLVGALSGSFTVDASYAVASPQRVDINFLDSTLEPEQLQAVFGAQVPLLLSVFNPQGWLEITYVDQQLRVGRDDKGLLFVLERLAETAP